VPERSPAASVRHRHAGAHRDRGPPRSCGNTAAGSRSPSPRSLPAPRKLSFANNGQQALTKLAAEPFDVVVTDADVAASGTPSADETCAKADLLPLHIAERRVHASAMPRSAATCSGCGGLPFPIVEGVTHHHHPLRSNEQTSGVIGASHVSDRLCHDLTKPTEG
jgi:hypothetical protein